MSDHHEEDHSGPVKTPRQFLTLMVLSFMLPVFIIIGLVYFITSQPKPSAGSSNSAEMTAARLQKVGVVQIHMRRWNVAPDEVEERMLTMHVHVHDGHQQPARSGGRSRSPM